MANASKDAHSPMQGHVIVYARNARWRRSAAKSLAGAGHSYHVAAEAQELRRLLMSQRFDLMALKVQDESEARDIAGALEEVPLPPHSIFVGNEKALPLMEHHLRKGTLRFSPGQVPPGDLLRLVNVSLSSGSWQDISDNGATSMIEEVDLEEAIDNAAAGVYAQAQRKGQRFNTVIEGVGTGVLADPVRLMRTLASLLRLVVGVAPRAALISVEARMRNGDWTIRIGSASKNGAANGLERLSEALKSQTRVLRAAYHDVTVQGGLLWVEVPGSAALAVCLSLPAAHDVEEAIQHERELLPATAKGGGSSAKRM